MCRDCGRLRRPHFRNDAARRDDHLVDNHREWQDGKVDGRRQRRHARGQPALRRCLVTPMRKPLLERDVRDQGRLGGHCRPVVLRRQLHLCAWASAFTRDTRTSMVPIVVEFDGLPSRYRRFQRSHNPLVQKERTGQHQRVQLRRGPGTGCLRPLEHRITNVAFYTTVIFFAVSAGKRRVISDLFLWLIGSAC